MLGFCDVCQTLEIPRAEFGKEVWDVEINAGQAAMLCRILVVNVEGKNKEKGPTPLGWQRKEEQGKEAEAPSQRRRP